MSTSRITDAWSAAIGEFLAQQLSAGYAPATVEVRGRRLRSLARSMDAAPWAVSTDALRAWLGGYASRAAEDSNRQTAHAFYTWGIAFGYTATNPTPLAGVAAMRDRHWEDAISLFGAGERASGRTPATITKRRVHLRRFARDIGLGPWAVTYEHIRTWLDGRDWERATIMAHRSSIRAFYRWAATTGRVQDDIAEEPSRRAKQLPSPATWEQPLSDYRSFLRAIGRSEETVRTRINNVRRFARANPTYEPWAVTLDDLITWLAGHRWARETRKSNRDALQGFYRWALDSGRIATNPAAKIPPVRGSTPMPRPVLDDAYNLALAKAGERERLALRLGAELGLRRGEIVQVHSRDIQGALDQATLTVHGKGAKDRVLPLTYSLASSLRARGEGFVLPGGVGGHIGVQRIGKLISDLLPAGVSMHALRHRFATRVYNIDRDVFTTQQLLGHASPATTQRYVQVSDINMRRLVEAASI